MIQKYKHTIRSTTQGNGPGVNNRCDVVHPFYMFGLVVISLILLAFVGCKSLPAPKPTNAHNETDDSIRTELRIDTIYRDRWHTEYRKGDTVFIHDSIDRWRIREVYIHDSINNSRIDTIYQDVEVEKQGSAFLQRSGLALWIIIALLIIGVVVGIIIKVAK